MSPPAMPDVPTEVANALDALSRGVYHIEMILHALEEPTASEDALKLVTGADEPRPLSIGAQDARRFIEGLPAPGGGSGV